MSRPPSGPENVAVFAGLCVLGGVGYTLTSILSYTAQRHLRLSVYHSAMKLASFLPILFFCLVFKERLTMVQWTGIVSAAFPLLMLSFVTSPEDGTPARRRALAPLVGAILGVSALQIINTAAVKEEYGFGIDKILFIVGINIVAAPTGMLAITLKRERVRITAPLLTAGLVAGVLNIASFACFLEALRTGPASVILPLNSFHVFISTILTETLPTKKAKLGIGGLTIWALVSIVLLVSENK